MVDKEKYIQKIKILHEKKTGKQLSDSEAFELFENLVTLVSVIYRPIPKKFFENSSCPHCEEPIVFNFRDELSEKEFLISGLCQKCQDLTFK